MSTVLITGATGFTGRYLASRLAQTGYEVHGTVYGTPGDPIDGVAKLHAVDLGDFKAVERTVSEVAPDKIVHLAAISFVAHSDVTEMYRTNVLGTRNLLAALAGCERTPSTIVLASSANYYGNAHEGMLHESLPPAPANDYGVTKVAAELVAELFRDQLPIIVVRPFNYTGRGQSEHFLIPKIVSHVASREPEIELGNLDVARDFSDVRGVVDVYQRLLGTPAAIGGTFNICSGRATSLRELLDMLRRISGHEFTVRTNARFVREREVKMLCGSSAKLESLIGPLNMPPLEQTLRWMLEG